jgi:N-acetylglucosamine kinase-like BadF-type ATPase
VAYYLGIDGGGSKTSCAVGDARSILAMSTAGPSNITRVDEMRARESLHQAIREACATAKINPRQIDRACIGAAGAGRQEVADVLRRIVAEVINGEIEVVGDMAIAMEAAFGAGPGVIVIAGTGSIAYGRNAQGTTARAGGWGFAISDEGSAHWIGRAAVANLLREIDHDEKQLGAQDAAEDLSLLRELKAVWNLRSLEEFVRTANSHPDFAALLPAILAAADAGNISAQLVLEQAGAELSRLASTVIRKLFAEPDASSTFVKLAMVGGVFRHSARVREYFRDELRKFAPHAEVNQDVVEPVSGALEMARQPRAKQK